MKRSVEVPKRVVRVTTGTPEIDLEKRTIRSRIMTKLIARDGGIIKPEGIISRFFEANPVVLAIHGFGDELRSPVIGKSLGLERADVGMDSVTQFAETDLGREYGYLYGVNPKKEVFMRAWSFGWATLQMEWWNREEAKSYLGSLWDEDTAARLDTIWVAVKSEMHEYSAVAVGSDREALSRAFSDGVRAAGELISEMDLGEAKREIRALQERLDTFGKSQGEVRSIVERLQKDMQALRDDGAAAVSRGDSAALLQELRAIGDLLKR
jgi:hypothetical protein